MLFVGLNGKTDKPEYWTVPYGFAADRINIKRMNRLEQLYTCLSNMCKVIDKNNDTNYPLPLKHYLEDFDHNELLYHNRSEDMDLKIETVLQDIATIITAYESNYDNYSEYQLLIQVVEDQTLADSEGKLQLKTAKSDMTASILQNPTDPNVTYKKKAGERIYRICCKCCRAGRWG